MPIWARAIIFGIELVGFFMIGIFATVKFYKGDYSKEHNKAYAVKNMKFNLLYFSINFAIILLLFLFTFPSYIFFSYNKLILVTIFVLLSVTIIIIALTSNKKWLNVFCLLFAIMTVVAFIIFIFMLTRIINIENKLVIYEEDLKTSLTPTMFSENQIGYTADSEGNIKTYIFYYQGNNDVWKYKDLDASEVKVEKIKDADTYIEKTVINTSYCKQEKKPTEEDYIYSEEAEKYTIYLNINQRVEIKID